MKLRLAHLNRRFGQLSALDDLSLECEGVHSLVLIGPSGGGKSTLLRVLAGLETPDSGSVEINGAPLAFEERALRGHRLKTGVVFQSFNLFPHLTALENITLPLTAVHGFTQEAARQKALSLLSRFQLESHAGHKPAALSGGQRQRVAIARALAIEPPLLLLDEPTSALDPVMTGEVLDTIDSLRALHCDFVLATHEMGFARQVADLVAVIADGRLVECAPPKQLFESPASPVTRRFLARVLRY
jgi:polar amino acid transport system ATP-binding protein